MAITVEFYGIPRARAGVSQTRVCDGVGAVPFSQVIAEVSRQFPEFAASCTHDGLALSDGYVASVDGDRFLHGKEAMITSGQSVLILSADAGG